MSLQLSIILIMLFIIVYVAIINFFSILFRMTGLTSEKSKFQTISLFTAVGFTTTESEIISTDKTRRKIATVCMLTGNVFSVIIVSLIVNLISNFNVTNEQDAFVFIAIAFAAFLAILIIFQLPPVKKLISKIISSFVRKLFSRNKAENFLTLLDNYGENAIVEVYINRLPAMFEEKNIFESGLKKNYGVNMLMLKRHERVVNVTKDTMIQKNDQIVVFGNYAKIKEIFLVNNTDEKTPENESANTVELMDNFISQAMAKVVVRELPEIMKNKTIEECKLKALYGINIMMVQREQGIIDVNRSTRIQENDEIIVFGPFNNIKYLFLESTQPAQA